MSGIFFLIRPIYSQSDLYGLIYSMPTHPTALHLIIAKNELYLQYAIQI